MECDCPPSCSEQFFRIQPTVYMRQRNFSSSLRISPEEIPLRFRNDSAFWEYSRVSVFFKDISCIRYRREIYVSWDSLIASFGGIFGLCLGGSVISMFEMVYWFTFRWWHRMFVLAMRQRRNRQRAVASTDDDGHNEGNRTPDLTRYGYVL